ncbi:MAG TPA: hypothetical protein VKV15_03150 [Bryobacteraceae bacterium]|nr:hypothetical protein [Bryobacteraceae bacterium]
MRTLMSIVLFLTTATTAASAQEMPKPAYDFSLPRDARIKLAESAAPAEISGNATVYLLERTGYVKVREGTNGFSCLVDRQTPWNLEPTCFDSEGTATTLLTRLFVEEQRAKGITEEKIKNELEEGYRSGRFQAPRKPGIAYMMSENGYLLVAPSKLVRIPAHLMFYAPYANEKDIGSPSPDIRMPRVIRPGQPDAYIVVIPAAAKHAEH